MYRGSERQDARLGENDRLSEVAMRNEVCVLKSSFRQGVGYFE